MSKAIAVQAIFLIAVIAIFLFFIAAIFWGWIDTTKFGTNQASCIAKKTSYCSGLVNKGEPPFDWNTKEPIDCSQFGISTAPTETECCEQYPGPKC